MSVIVFGGAFDPPHRVHVEMLKNAARELNATQAVIVPTFQPPHKSEGFLDYSQREELIRIAFSDIGIDFTIDPIENERKRENYTSVILPILKEKYKDIIYLIGGDSFQYFDTWINPRAIVECCPIAVCEREGYTDAREVAQRLSRTIGGDYKILKYKGAGASSSRVKAELLIGGFSSDLQESVMRYISERGLFGEYRQTIEKLKGFQSAELFYHSKCVVFEAVKLNSVHNLKQDFKKIFLAALLHDNAKERPTLDNSDIPSDCVGTPVQHQFSGAERAPSDFGIYDEEILNAIRYHTTAKPAMTVLEKLIYTADSVSQDRAYDPIPYLRQTAEKNFDEGFKAILRYTYLKLLAKNKPVYPLTVEAAKYYLGDSDAV